MSEFIIKAPIKKEESYDDYSDIEDEEVEEESSDKTKRKFVLVTSDFSGLGFAIQEIEKNGSEVIIAYKPKEPIDKECQEGFDNTGLGIVEKMPLSDFMAKKNQYKKWYIVWDGNHNTKENDTLRAEGFKVWGGQAEAYKMENEREYTLKLAESYGLHSPEHHEFKSIDEGVAFLEEHEDKAFVYKANGQDDCSLTRVPAPGIEPSNANIEMRATIQALGIDDFILQEKVDGVEVNVEYFVVNGEPVFCQANFEDKRIYNGDLGVNTGCMLDVCFSIPMDCRLAQETAGCWLPYAKKLNFTGFVDANCIIGKDGVFFLETCWRTGYNAHPNFFATISKKTFLQTCAEMIDGEYEPEIYDGFGASLTIMLDKPRAGMPIYCPESILPNVHFFDVQNDGDKYLTAGYSKEIAIITAHDWTIERAFEKALSNAEKFRLDDKFHRTDAHKCDYHGSPKVRYDALCAMKVFE